MIRGAGRKTFSWKDRLHGRRDFERVFAHGRRWQEDGLTAWIFPGDAGAGVRLGLSVPRTFGGAVQRNRWKRLVRESFRLNRDRLTCGADMVLRPRGTRSVARRQEMDETLLALWTRAGLCGTATSGEPAR